MKTKSSRLIILLLISGFLTGCSAIEFPILWLIGELRGPYHNTTTVADLNEDGHLDIVLVNVRKEHETIYWGDVTYWMNQGFGRFSARVPELPPLLHLSPAAGDLDGDGDADLLLLVATELMPYFNQGGDQGGIKGELKGGGGLINYPSVDPGTPGSVYLGDLDNDGKLDAFVAGCCGMLFDLGDGNTDYLPSYAYTWIDSQTKVYKVLGDFPMRGAALGDLNNDGSLDVFAAILSPKPGREGSPADRVLLNDGSGNFRDSGQRLGDSDSTAVALGDLDGDSDLDAVVGTLAGAVIWINQGGAQGGRPGEFAPSTHPLGGGETKAVFLADFDGDDNLDALVAGVRQAILWWNDGQGSFERSNKHIRYSERHGLAVGDFNGNGYPDIFAGSYDWHYRVWFDLGRDTFWLDR